MKRFGQIPGSTPLDAAAGFVLGQRLAKLREFAELISSGEGDDVESIHQFRVFCRRIHAASNVFCGVVPASHLKKLGKRLKRVRRSAGRIRDCDVLAMELEQVRVELTPEELPAAEYLSKVYPRRRQNGRRRLERKLAKLDRKGFWEWVGRHYPKLESLDSASSVATGRRRTLSDLAREKLPSELDAFLDILSREPQGDYAQLHQVRIAAKRLRYVLDVFAGCFPPEYRREIYDPIKRIQDSLGAINDAHTFSEQFDRLARLTDKPRLVQGLSLIRDRYLRRLTEMARVFSELWTADQRRDYSDRFHAVLIAIDDFSPPSSAEERENRNGEKVTSPCPNPV